MSYKVWWSDEDNSFVAICEQQPYQLLSAFGDTEEEALEEIKQVVYEAECILQEAAGSTH